MTIQAIGQFREHYSPATGRRNDAGLRIIWQHDQYLHFSLASHDVSACLDKNPALSYVLSFPLEFIGDENYYHLFSLATSLKVEPEWGDDIRSIIRLMVNEYTNDPQSQLLERYLRILLIYVSRHAHPVSQPRTQRPSIPLVQQFVLAVERYFRTKRMVSDYADILSVTPNYLNEVVKRNTGDSAGSHIRQRVALEAQRMAVYANLSMKEVAYELGFPDPCYFSRFFRAVIGVNYSDFKRTGTAA